VRKRISIKFLFLFVLCSALFLNILGCASTPIKASIAKHVSPDRVFGTIQTVTSRPANVTIVCDKGMGGPAYLLRVNGKDIAKIHSGEKIDFKIDPGSHIFAVKMWEGTHVEVETVLKENERAFYRITIPGYGIAIQKSAEIGE